MDLYSCAYPCFPANDFLDGLRAGFPGKEACSLMRSYDSSSEPIVLFGPGLCGNSDKSRMHLEPSPHC
jgi:hypothetical protein